jgi:hypothetical protein
MSKQNRITLSEETLLLLMSTKVGIKSLDCGFFSYSEIVHKLLENLNNDDEQIKHIFKK